MQQLKYRLFSFLFVFSFLFSVQALFGQPGKDGSKIINASSTVVNDYTVLIADATTGSTSIQVSSNNLSSGFTSPLSTGDLILIIQIQGASINGADDPSYGDILNYNNCGNYEFAEVGSISGTNQISISCPLAYNYTSAGKVEVVRVPRYSVLTVNGGAGITCPAWNGTTGGIVAVEVTGTTTINGGGSIDATGKGFRGGLLQNSNSAYGVLNFRWPVNDYGAQKGESIAGYGPEYDLIGGRYCKGAPANGGGGGNGHNAGGGGGSNAGNVSSYTGNGNPDISNASWATAWNLESPGFASSVSSGGGKGGYTFSSSNQNALSVGPFNSAWGGDFRRENGGRGGRPLDYSTGRLFMGGGGGAGEENNTKGGAGGNGGGIIVFLTHADISGSGQIVSNGNNGFSTTTSNGTDGVGGGGGGGTIYLNSTGNISGISINANGGNGGSQIVSVFNAETEGPGGGGGGGYIATTTTSSGRSATGGNNGTTNSTSMTEFPPNGSTKGGAGINNASISSFVISTQPINLCNPASVTLTFTTQGNPPPGSVYTWYDQPFGGSALGTGSTFTTPVISSSKTYYIGTCPGTFRVPLQVNVSSPPAVSFSANTVCAGSPTQFTSGGSGTLISWNWNFGDGSPASTQQNPPHTYTSGGTYSVTLTASDGVCSSSSSQSVTVTNSPTANFTSTASTCGTLNIQFANASSGASSYSWNFGDGTAVSSQTNPSHTYSASGNYSVILNALAVGCSAADTLSIYVGVAPLASYSANTPVCQSDSVHFSNLSNGNGQTIASLNWNFGDGSPVSSQQNPTHAYANPGTYTATLTVNTAQCTDDTTITIQVTAGPVVSFSSSSTSGCTPLSVSFINTTTGGTVYDWNFGDGSPHSTLSAPVHSYSSPGTYTVTLISSQGSCADTLVIQNMVQVANTPLSSFSAIASICLGDSLHFSNSSIPNGSGTLNYTWDFGDGSPASSLTNPVHYYSSPGVYSVTLTATNGICSDDSIWTINVSNGPIASFSAPVTAACGSLNVNFLNTTTGAPIYNWNFGDGSPNSSLTNPSHTYSTPGSYTVTLIANQGTCSDTVQQINYIQIANPPTGSFTVSNACDGDSVRLISNSLGGPITAYSWSFGDGNTGTGNPVAHIYASSGTYSVQLTVTAAACSDDTTIVVTVNPTPVVTFSSSATDVCDSATINFSNTTTGAVTYNWLFGDGSTSNAMSPSHTYLTPGNYSVTLQAITAAGCSQLRTRLNLIRIHETPAANFTATTQSACTNSCISFDAQSSPGTTSWQWTIPGGNPSLAAGQNSGNICFPTAGNFDVTLEVSDGLCSSTKTVSSFIHIANCSLQPIAQFISGDTSFCENSCIDFVDLSANAVSWQWLFPGATPASSTVENPANICYRTPGDYSVTLIAGNPTGFDTVIYTNLIHVDAGPAIPSFTQNGNILTASPALSYQWFYNGLAISGANAQQYTATLSGGYAVLITDINGCTALSPETQVSLVGFPEISDNVLFYLYPNPINDHLQLLYSTKKSLQALIVITDATGRRIFSTILASSPVEQKISIDLTDFSKGVYFFQILSGDQCRVRPIIKQ